jgi:hypothetical protein
MRTELTVAFVAGLFGLIPLMVQIASTRAQRRDRMTRLNHLRAELELLERLSTLQEKVGATDEAAKPQTNRVISDSLSKLLEQYDQLSEIAPSAISGGKQPSPQQLSLLRRAFLLYRPHTISEWILHTLCYMFASIFVVLLLVWILLAILVGDINEVFAGAIVAFPFGIAFLIARSVARFIAARNAAQLEKSNA